MFETQYFTTKFIFIYNIYNCLLWKITRNTSEYYLVFKDIRQGIFYELHASFPKNALYYILLKSYMYIPKITTILIHLLCREIINLRSPKRFNEKLEWIKIYYKNDNISICSDKYTVREYMDCKIQLSILNYLISTHGTIENINFEHLPDKFVIKFTHDSGYNIIVKNKNNIDKNDIYTQIYNCLSKKHSNKYFEFHYNQIKSRLIIENFLEETASNKLPTDYKIYYFNRIPKIILVISGRETKKTYIDYFNISWKRMHIGLTSQESATPPSPPKTFNTMLCYA